MDYFIPNVYCDKINLNDFTLALTTFATIKLIMCYMFDIFFVILI